MAASKTAVAHTPSNDCFKKLVYSERTGRRSRNCDTTYKALCKAYTFRDSFDPVGGLPMTNSQPGAIFNLTFSPDGSLIVAACEKSNILLLDPICQKQVLAIDKAHGDCVNCIRFLDTRIFASGSDDCTVKLWDQRNTKQSLCTLKGHNDWVKNVEYNPKTKQVITSAFDNSIRVWNINEWLEDGKVTNSDVMHIDYLMRMKLSVCMTKMIITTTNCASIIVHNLNLEDLVEEPLEFDWSSLEDYRISSCSNSVEVVEDFPDGSDSFCISSATVHPYGWAMLSRFTNRAHSSEWTALHDIQDQHHHNIDCEVECKSMRSSRLQYYIEEPNVGRGFIKEQCFSSSGRIVSSPFGNGIRLLSFNEACSDLSTTNWNSKKCKKFTEIKTLLPHSCPVLTTQFSPTMPLLVSGCLGGKICFSQPRF